MIAPKVWIGCLACYNAGDLRGGWYDATEAGEITPEQIHHGFPTPHEELWVFDHEGFDGFLTGECSPSEAQRIAEGLAEVDDSERIPYVIFLKDQGAEPDREKVDEFREHYRGGYQDEAEFAEEWATELGSYNDLDPLHAYIDWDRYARDLFIDAFWGQRGSDGPLHVFDRY